MGIIPEIASVAMLLRKDQKPCSVFAREAVQIVAPLNVAILGVKVDIPTNFTMPNL